MFYSFHSASWSSTVCLNKINSNSLIKWDIQNFIFYGKNELISASRNMSCIDLNFSAAFAHGWLVLSNSQMNFQISYEKTPSLQYYTLFQ